MDAKNAKDTNLKETETAAQAKAAKAGAAPVDETNDPKSGCAKSFILDERGEMNKLCEEPENPKQEYVETKKEKEAGGEG